MLGISKKWVKVICVWCAIVIGTLGILGLAIYGIYKIPNKEVRDIVLTLTAALLGGLLTLIGVAWTIRNSEKNIRLENRMKNKPIMLLDNHARINKSAIINENGQLSSHNLWCVMKNISQMPCKVIGVNYLGKEVQCIDKNLWLENQENVQFSIQVNNFNYNNKKIDLILEDISGIRYAYLLEYDDAGKVLSIREKE